MKLNDIKPIPERLSLLMLIGLPGSGKSTWVENFLRTTDKKYVVLSTDTIIERMAKEMGTTYSEIWSSAIDEATRENYANFKTAIKNQQNIIWDQTNLTSRKRINVLSNVGSLYEKVAVTFELPLDIIFERVENRAKETDKNIPKNILINMQKSYVKPSLDEGFDKIIKGN